MTIYGLVKRVLPRYLLWNRSDSTSASIFEPSPHTLRSSRGKNSGRLERVFKQAVPGSASRIIPKQDWKRRTMLQFVFFFAPRIRVLNNENKRDLLRIVHGLFSVFFCFTILPGAVCQQCQNKKTPPLLPLSSVLTVPYYRPHPS